MTVYNVVSIVIQYGKVIGLAQQSAVSVQ